MEKLHVKVIVLEGTAKFTAMGDLQHKYIRLTLRQLRSIIWSLQLRGIYTHWTRNLSDTIGYLRMFDEWMSKVNHNSLFKRPKAALQIVKPGIDPKKIYFLQGLDGVSVTKAMNILDHFAGKLPFTLSATEKEFSSIPAVGPITARRIVNFFEQ